MSLEQPARADRAAAWRAEAAVTARLAWPLIVAQLAAMALTTTDMIMLGWLGADRLAAGTIATAFLHPLLMLGMGVVMASAPLIAQALGAKGFRSVRRSVRQGLWVAFALAAPMIAVLLNAAPILRLLGQPPALVAMAQNYLDYAAWSFVGFFCMTVLRGLVSAFGLTQAVLVISLAGVAINALADYALIFGHFGMPKLELRGAGLSTSIVHSAMCLMLLGYIVTHRRLKRLAILGRFWRPDWPRFLSILRIGFPIGITITAESGLFSAAAMLMGWLGAEALAAHAIALQLAAIAFMTPLGLSQATTVRVGIAYGRRDREALARAGWVSMGLALAYMSCTALILKFAPLPLIGLFLDRHDPANAGVIGLATGFLAVAALFQLVDGLQVTAAASLRGMNDTAKPMLMAIVGYWAIGLPVAWALGFPAGLGGVGIWLGLAAGLAVTAVALTWRFARKSARPLRGAPPRD